MTPACSLCESLNTAVFQTVPFLKCQDCGLIFKDPALYLSSEEEKKRYGMHENKIEDPAYVKFLWPAVEQVKKLKIPPATGLDYGCGPNPVLSQLLTQENFKMFSYDPYFFPIPLAEFRNLDFITCTEAAEHFYSPGFEFKKLFKMLKPRGVLVLMTDLFQRETVLQNWHYTRDPSHVCFFSEQSLTWLSQLHGLDLNIHSTRLASFRVR